MKTRLKKYSFLKKGAISITTLCLLLLMQKRVEAIELDPQRVEIVKGKRTTVVVIARPDVDIKGVELRLQISGGKFVDYTPPQEHLTIGACDGGEMFTAEQICVDLVNNERIMNGDSLGTIKLKVTSDEANVVTGGNNRYVIKSNGDKYVSFGLAGSYGINAKPLVEIGTTNTIQPTIITDENIAQEDTNGNLDGGSSIIFILSGVFAIVGVLYLVVILFKKNKQTDVKEE